MAERDRLPERRSLPRALSELSEVLDFPPTPDIAGRVRLRLIGARPSRRLLSVRSVRWSWATAALITALLLTALVLGLAPAVREAVADRLGLTGVRFFSTDAPGPAATITPESSDLGARLSLGEAVTLDEARARVSFPIAVPAALGPPDEVYSGAWPPGGQISLVYLPRAGLPEARETGVAVLLTQFRAESEPFIEKGLAQGTRLTPVTVNGRRAYWVEGAPHLLFLRDPSGLVQQERSRLAANALLWEQNGITYRLESALDREIVLRIAETLRWPAHGNQTVPRVVRKRGTANAVAIRERRERTMRWRSIGAFALVVLASAVLASRVEAGGWATVQLDAPIGEVRAGQAVDVGFMVRQHGVTPIHVAFGQPVRAVFVASSQETGERVATVAVPDKPTGHFRVEVVFPTSGIWQIEIVPEPFAGTRLAPVTVLSATGERRPASAADEASIARAPSHATAAARDAGGNRRDEMLAAFLVVAAVALTGVVFLSHARFTRPSEAGAKRHL